MLLLEEYKSELQNIVDGLSNAFNLESAIFDVRSRLISSTQTYLERKGSTVHAPSVEEVITNGNILVNKPGYMKSCMGCRFKERCPSTIEILNCIKVDNHPVGVIALTSFTKTGHNRIVQNTQVYMDILDEISKLVSNTITNRHKGGKAFKAIPVSTSPKFTLSSIIGNSQAMLELKNKACKIMNSTSTVMITGETGTGKGLFARAIHYESIRSGYPFISINCASIPENLFESELFGYEEGAFTGARKGGKPGRFQLAEHGTLLLDEIGEMPLHIQSKLLKVLQERTIERVGGTDSIPINVRIIASTNKNIEEMVERKEFREDLYYRLNVIPINIPPLRFRKGDIELLSKEFLKKNNLLLNKNILSFSPRVINIFNACNWSGNIRELENVIEYAVNMEESDSVTLSSLPEKYLKQETNNLPSMRLKVESAEFEIIKTALDKHGWDVQGKALAAEELGIGLRTLYRKIKHYTEAS